MKGYGMGPQKSLEEIRKLWEQEPDKYIIKAATKDINEYPPNVREIILQEVHRRGLTISYEPEPQKPKLSKEKAKRKDDLIPTRFIVMPKIARYCALTMIVLGLYLMAACYNEGDKTFVGIYFLMVIVGVSTVYGLRFSVVRIIALPLNILLLFTVLFSFFHNLDTASFYLRLPWYSMWLTACIINLCGLLFVGKPPLGEKHDEKQFPG